MPSVDYSGFDQPQGTTSDGTKLDNFIAAVQTTVNAIDDANISPSAAIAYTKLALTGKIVNADIAAAAAIAISKLAGYPTDGTKALFGDGTWKVTGAANVGSELDYKQITADAATTSHNTEGAADTIIDGNSITYDGSRVKVEIFAPQINNVGGATGPATAVLLRDTTVIGQVALTQGLGSTAAGNFAYAVTFDTPSAAAHVYKWHMFGGGTSTYTVKAGTGATGALTPAFIRVTKA